ncbi:MAG: MarR family transcriptional regulator [Bacteroidota bacterium]|nr:MarR family transcriptional regulator [Bacteroidota bacterium]MDP4233713.1 MarR family transcriptional regulator [Bacteroidota bacterium]MDP4242352.1 MarR family transcriptional regulator [Bacteroidota bacterium]MDP4288695.1 MarR family transcriptional regulator [Bacteroidota bacterium]
MNHPVTDILNGFRVMVHALQAGSRSSEEKHGITGAQLFVLEKLREARSLTVSELAARTHTHQSTVSVVVSKLVEKGLVARERSEKDARVQMLSITTRGREVLRRTPETVQDRLVAAIGELTESEQTRLHSLLSKVLAGAGLADVQPALFLETRQ